MAVLRGFEKQQHFLFRLERGHAGHGLRDAVERSSNGDHVDKPVSWIPSEVR